MTINLKGFNYSKTPHKIDCKMAFGRKDESCPRCKELIEGAKPGVSWSPSKRYCIYSHAF